MDERRRVWPGRRQADRADREFKVNWRENWYRDILAFVVALIALLAVIRAHDATVQANRAATKANVAATQANTALRRVQEGRRTAVAVTCGATSAVIDAGRGIITGNAGGLPPRLVQNLEQLGYPPKKVRDAQANKAANQYAQLIATRVRESAGAQNVKGVVNPNGTLNCAALLNVSNVAPK